LPYPSLGTAASSPGWSEHTDVFATLNIKHIFKQLLGYHGKKAARVITWLPFRLFLNASRAGRALEYPYYQVGNDSVSFCLDFVGSADFSVFSGQQPATQLFLAPTYSCGPGSGSQRG
jgi:hypothetical protein